MREVIAILRPKPIEKYLAYQAIKKFNIKISENKLGDIITVKLNGVECFMHFFQSVNFLGVTIEDLFCYQEYIYDEKKDRSTLSTNTYLLDRFKKTLIKKGDPL